jgi:hypothetical protein
VARSWVSTLSAWGVNTARPSGGTPRIKDRHSLRTWSVGFDALYGGDAVKASFSLFFTFRGTVTETSSNGLLVISRSIFAHAYTVRAAFTETVRTVSAERFGVISALDHARAVSAVRGSAFGESRRNAGARSRELRELLWSLIRGIVALRAAL